MNEDFPTLTPFEHTFDYGKTYDDLLTEGEYGDRDRGCKRYFTNENFPVTETGVVTRKGDYARFGCLMKDAEVDTWCEENGKRRGTAHETLTIGVAEKSVQRNYCVASGQTMTFHDGRHSATLSESGGSLGVFLVNIDDVTWPASYQFVIFDIEPQSA